MRSQPRENTPALNIRIKAQQRRVIEQAAEMSDKTVSDFVRDAALREAQNTLLDRTDFHLDAKTWERFTTALDAPLKDNPRLRDLLSRKVAWNE